MASRSQASTTSETAQEPRRAGRYPIAVLAKALDLLDLLDAHEVLTLTELSARAGINKATALRVLANLEDRGYVERDAATGRYRLGFRLLQLGMRKTEGLDLRTAARPILRRLHAAFDETVNLAVPGPDGIIYIDILESAHGLRMAATVGRRDDYHSSALGKAMMAYRAASWFDEVLRRQPLVQKTPHTIVDPDTLRRELARVRERGYALDDEENELGARCVAAPIFDHRGGVIGAISLSGPASRLAPERLVELAGSITAASQQVSAQMGFKDTDPDGCAPSAPASKQGEVVR